MKPSADGQSDAFYAKLDAAKGQGRGSCCSAWTFFLLLGGILVIGIVLIFTLF